MSLNQLGELAREQGNLPEAQRLFGESLRIAQRLAESVSATGRDVWGHVTPGVAEFVRILPSPGRHSQDGRSLTTSATEHRSAPQSLRVAANRARAKPQRAGGLTGLLKYGLGFSGVLEFP